MSKTSSDSISITDVSVTDIPATSLSPIQHRVVVKGTFINTASQVVTTSIELVTGNSISSRSALITAITNDSYSGVVAHPEVSIKLVNVAPQKTIEWQLTFNGNDYFSPQDVVAVFGAQISESSQQILVPHSWYFKDSFKPTQLLVNAVVTTSSFHPVGQSVDLAVGTNEIDRINSLLDVMPRNSSVMVDPYLRDWLIDFDGTELSGKANQLTERLKKYSAYSAVYAQTNLFQTIANELSSITTNAVVTGGTSMSVYSPSSDVVSKSVFNEVTHYEKTLVVIPNDSFGSNQQTMATHGITNNSDFLISDSGLADCLVLNNELLARECLTAMLSVITAESPNKARAITLAVPLNAIDTNALIALNHAEQFGNSFRLIDISTALNSTSVFHSIPQGPVLHKNLSAAMRKGLSQLQTLSKSVETVFADEALSRKLKATTYFALSDMRTSEKDNLELVNSATSYASKQLHTLTLQGSSRITIPGTKSSLPITIVNGSDHTATVGIQLSSSLPGRISAANIDAVTIEPGMRMTVQIPITVSGAGAIPVQAYLTSRDNDSFGKPLSIQIASSAYQDIARNLVWTALALLVILLANRLRKRRQSN